MSYQHERDTFIARMSQEGLPVHISQALLRAATSMQRYAELACGSEAADRDRVPCPATRKRPGPCLCDYYKDAHADVPRITVQDYQCEQRLKAVMPASWSINTQDDPRGYVLRVIPPSYAERNAGKDRFNLDAIGVPTR